MMTADPRAPHRQLIRDLRELHEAGLLREETPNLSPRQRATFAASRRWQALKNQNKSNGPAIDCSAQTIKKEITMSITNGNGVTAPRTLPPGTAPAGEIVFLLPPQLRIHPDNIRVYYPPEDVQEMADSVEAAGGLIQAMIVVPDPERPGGYLVVDGNMRLAGGRHLGDNCPPLKCEVVSMSHADQLLAMAVTSHAHYPKDPISQARHYKRLMDQEGYSQEGLAERMGCSQAHIRERLILLDYPEAIQELVAGGQLSPNGKVASAIMSSPDPARRLKEAQRFARSGTTIKQIIRSCQHIARQEHVVNDAPPPPKKRRPATPRPAPTGDIDAARIQDIASKTLCEGCRLDGLGPGGKCWTCAGPYEFITALVEMAEFRVVADDS